MSINVANINHKIKVGSNVVIESPCSITADEIRWAKIGFMTYIRARGVCSSLDVGRFCSIATGLSTGIGSHPTNWVSSSPFQYNKSEPLSKFDSFNAIAGTLNFKANRQKIKIGNDVWVGQDVMIMNGITIGDGAIIAARAVVTKDVPPYAIVAGVPAKVVKYRHPDHIIEALLDIQWWNYDLTSVDKTLWDKPEAFIADFYRLLDSGKLKKLKPKCYRLNPKKRNEPVSIEEI